MNLIINTEMFTCLLDKKGRSLSKEQSDQDL